MAVPAQLYPERLGLLPVSGLQDCMLNNPVSGFEGDLCFAFQEPQQQNFFFQQPNSQNFGFDNCNIGASSSSTTTCDSSLFMSLSHYLDAQLDMQRQEIDCMLQLQAERLRSALQQQWNQQLRIILNSVESKVEFLIRQKEGDLAKVANKNMELEVCLRKVELETQQWQRVAKEKEAMVVGLSNTLEESRERLFMASNKVQDAGSLCRGSCDREQDQDYYQSLKKMVCKGCNSRSSCIIFFPCRHLCSCKSCEAFLGSCPVCNSVKESSMEVLGV